MLALTTVVANYLAVSKIIPDEISRWIGFASLIAGVGFIVGWLCRSQNTQVTKPLVLAAVLIFLNTSLWYINSIALFFFDEGARAGYLEINPFAVLLLSADRAHFFDFLAIAIPLAMVFAGIKSNSRFSSIVGTIGLLVWVSIVAIGYLTVSVCTVPVLSAANY